MSESPFKPDVLRGYVVLITGGGTGINFGIARQMAAHGAHLALMGRRKEVVEKSCADLTSEFGSETLAIQGDVRKYEDAERAIAETVKHFGKIDVLLNGAAGNFLSPAEKLSSNGFKVVIEIDLVGTFNMCRAAYSELSRSRSGVIINISATIGYTQTPFMIHASAAKVGVDSLTRSLAVEWGKDGIRVCGIAPGTIQGTEGFKRLDGENRLPTIPLGRFGTTDDIGYSAVFLASKAASYISGDTLVVDGAAWLWKPIGILDPNLLQNPTKKPASKL